MSLVTGGLWDDRYINESSVFDGEGSDSNAVGYCGDCDTRSCCVVAYCTGRRAGTPNRNRNSHTERKGSFVDRGYSSANNSDSGLNSHTGTNERSTV